MRVGGLSLSVEHRRRYSSGIVCAKSCESLFGCTAKNCDKIIQWLVSGRHFSNFFIQNRERSSSDYTEPVHGSRRRTVKPKKKRTSRPLPSPSPGNRRGLASFRAQSIELNKSLKIPFRRRRFHYDMICIIVSYSDCLLLNRCSGILPTVVIYSRPRSKRYRYARSVQSLTRFTGHGNYILFYFNFFFFLSSRRGCASDGIVRCLSAVYVQKDDAYCSHYYNATIS